MGSALRIIITLIILFLIDWYVYNGIYLLVRNSSGLVRNLVKYAYWSVTIITFSVLLLYVFGNPAWFKGQIRSLIFTGMFFNYASKLFIILFLFTDDLLRLGKWMVSLFQNPQPDTQQGFTRSEFLVKTAVVAGTVPLVAMTWGVLSGAHDYRIRRKTIYLPNLPQSFDGVSVAQISDIHSGSFFNKTAVKGGVEMLMAEKPDLVFFTGDLVNNETSEVNEYIDIFEKVKAPLGVYSVTGNHDYGIYKDWKSQAARNRNFQDLITAHKLLGYDLLMNEHRMIELGGEKIAILGIENWGTGRFPKFGKLHEAHAGAEEAAVRLLLSHDPSHWDFRVYSFRPVQS